MIKELRKIKKFNSKEEVSNYVIRMFKKDAKCICIRGSTAYKPLRAFSDIDFEYYSKKYKKPYYEIVFVGKKLVLICAYHQNFVEGKKIKVPKGVKLLYGEYNKNLNPEFRRKMYDQKEKITRECQIAVDFMFKYLRSKDEKVLRYVQRRLYWK